VKRIVSVKKMSKEQTIAVCFCGAAKTTSLGIPLVTAIWTQADDLTRAFITIPVLLYTIEQVSLGDDTELLILGYVVEAADGHVFDQVFMAQGLVYFFKWYLRRDNKPGPRDVEDVDNEEHPTSTARGDHESDVTAHDDDTEEVGQDPAVRNEEKGAMKSG
jgi:sodium/bile acid cotransporter 7